MEDQHSAKTFYQGEERLLVAVDCIIFGFDGKQLKLLLFKRKVDPYSGQWSLVGSFVKNSESLDVAAARILEESTGLKDVFMSQLHCFGSVNRDPGARVISVVYFALIRLKEFDIESVQKYDAAWFSIKEIPELIFDHRKMVEMAQEQLKKQARHQPIGFELLPKKFTFPQLLRLYEEIYQKDLDDRNFRKKIKAMNLLKRLDEKDKTTSRKGAFFYCFDSEKYHVLLAKGFNFEI